MRLGQGRWLAGGVAALVALAAMGAPAARAGDCVARPYDTIANDLTRLTATALAPRSPILPGASQAMFEFRHVPSPGAQPAAALFQAPYQNPLAHPDTWRRLDAVSELARVAGADGALADGSLIRFEVPRPRSTLWESYSYIAVTCDPAHPDQIGGWGVTQAVTANQAFAAAAVVALLVFCYVLAAAFVSHLRARPNPLSVRYPSLKATTGVTTVRLLDPVALTGNALNQASPQKLQALYFSLIVAGIVLYTLITSGRLSDISLSLLPLLGISAIGAAVSQAQSVGKDRLSFENWSWLVGKGVLPIARGGSGLASWGELATTGREFDIYKFQTILFSLVVGLALIRNYGDIATIKIPESLLGILGLSQIVYIGGVLAKPPSVAELNAALDTMRELDGKGEAALLIGLDTGLDGNPDPKATAAGPQASWAASAGPLKNIHLVLRRQAEQVARMIESNYEIPVDPAQLLPA